MNTETEYLTYLTNDELQDDDSVVSVGGCVFGNYNVAVTRNGLLIDNRFYICFEVGAYRVLYHLVDGYKDVGSYCTFSNCEAAIARIYANE